jgi:putative transposase
MDGRGRALDNIFIERLCGDPLGAVKYEEVYFNDYQTVTHGRERLASYFPFYNAERPHQALAYCTPTQVYFGA